MFNNSGPCYSNPELLNIGPIRYLPLVPPAATGIPVRNINYGWSGGLVHHRRRRAKPWGRSRSVVRCRNCKKGLLAARGRNGHGIVEAKCQHLFGMDPCRIAGCREDSGNSGAGANSRSDSRSGSAIYSGSDQCAQCSRYGDRAEIPIRGGVSLIADQLGTDGHLLAINEHELTQFNSDIGLTLNPPGFLDRYHTADHGLAGTCNNPAVHDDGLTKYSSESIPGLGAVGRQSVGDI